MEERLMLELQATLASFAVVAVQDAAAFLSSQSLISVCLCDVQDVGDSGIC